jgi:triacylglycerol lipase
MKPLVVLLHGLARGQGSMASLSSFLRKEGFETWSRTYPSRRHSISYLASALSDELVEAAAGRPLHAVTHSMGGIILRHLRDPRLQWSRAVMLAPPNQGSQLAAALVRNPLFRWFYGPAGSELADASTWPPPPAAEVAVIAGTRAFSLTNVTSWTMGRLFPAGVMNDGTVAVDETKLAGMTAFASVDATHTWIMNSPRVRHLIVTFLCNGRLD